MKDEKRDKKCRLCELHQEINADTLSPSDGLLENPKYSNVLMVSDHKRKNEYIFTINYCPMCGKKIK